MNRRTFLTATTAAAFALPSLLRGAAGLARPNIVYILADDLGYGDVGCFNSEAKTATPRIDGLAAGGMRFGDAHSPSAVCTPTRYGILTGRYCWRTRLKRGVLDGYDGPLLEPGRTTVASFLAGAGYSTACIGKWHLGLEWGLKDGAKPASAANVDFAKPVGAGPAAAGFAESFIIAASLDMDPYVYVENGKVIEQPTATVKASPRPAFYRAGPIAPSFKFDEVLDTFTARAVSFLERQAKTPERPFFLYLALPSPHTPHVPRKEFAGRSKAGVYGDFVAETDDSVGRVLDALERLKLAEGTLVIFTSDNGAHAAPLKLEQFGHTANGTLRGQKSDAWEGGHRIPFIARWPGLIAKGSTCGQTICLTDLLATAAAITHQVLPPNSGEDSVDLLPLMKGLDKPLREATVHHSIDGRFAIRQGNWKLILARGSGGWSLTENAAAALPEVQLYELDKDPREERNVASENPDVVTRLRALLEKYRSTGRST